MSAKKVVKALKKYSRFLITAHVGLEGDALGSELALASLLRKLGKQAFIVNVDKIPANYKFLPGAGQIGNSLRQRRYQAALILDCSDLRRIGSLAKLIDQDKPIINIDHHIDNQRFGQINWVDSRVSSVGEMIYALFRQARIKLNRQDALNIYVAILTDTGSFRHCNTSSRTFAICSQLTKLGVNPAEVYNRIYEKNSVRNMSFLAQTITQMKFAAGNQIAWVQIKQQDFSKLKDKPETTDKILDFAKSIDTVKVVMIFAQSKPNLVKVNLRSKSPINVQKLASRFGGGGHRFASGCSLKGSLKAAEKKLLNQAKKIVKTK